MSYLQKRQVFIVDCAKKYLHIFFLGLLCARILILKGVKYAFSCK